jgi:hypothetical protein
MRSLPQDRIAWWRQCLLATLLVGLLLPVSIAAAPSSMTESPAMPDCGCCTMPAGCQCDADDERSPASPQAPPAARRSVVSVVEVAVDADASPFEVSGAAHVPLAPPSGPRRAPPLFVTLCSFLC